ncbi:MAG TPA: hypothetical protein VG963_05360, partial [Polyangiaceae bacterium]|nr:hypothetical protein [Polyangiaceae bacterium]
GCLLLSSTQVAAQAVVNWSAPLGCPSAAEGRSEIAQLLGRTLAEVEAELSAAVRIRRVSAEAFEARISLRTGGRSSERTLRDRDCVVLAHAAAVVVALAVDSTASTRAPLGERTGAHGARSASRRPATPARGAEVPGGSSPAPQTAQPAPAPPPFALPPGRGPATTAGEAPTPLAETNSTSAGSATDASRAASTRVPEGAQPASTAAVSQLPRERARPSSEAEHLTAQLAAAAVLVLGTLPHVAPALSTALGVLGRGWCAALRVAYAPRQQAALRELGGVGGRLALLAGAIDGGLRLRLERLEIPLRLGAELGMFDAQGVRVVEAHRQRRLWSAAYLGSGVTFPWTRRFALGVRLEGLLALYRPAFAVRSNLGREYTFFRPELWGARASVELELRLP